MRVRLLVLLCLALSSGCGAAAGSPSSAQPDSQPATSTPAAVSTDPTSTPRLSLASARAAVQAYVDAYSRHSPRAICTLQASPLRRLETGIFTKIFRSPVACPAVMDTLFHPWQDNPPAVFRNVAVVAWRASGYDGDLARVSASLHVTFPNGGTTSPDPRTTVFYLMPEDGTWKMLAEGGLNRIVSDGSPALGDLMTPLSSTELETTARVAAPSFQCAGSATVSSDRADDVHDVFGSTETSFGPVIHAPWLDIQRVTLFGVDSAHACVEITLAQPVRAGTTIAIRSDGNLVAELALGAYPEYEWEGLSATGQPFGEQGSTLRLLLDGGLGDKLSICVTQQLATQPLANRISSPQDAWGYDANEPYNGCAG